MKALWILLVLISFQSLKGQENANADSIQLEPFELTSLASAAEETDEVLRRARETINGSENSFEINKRYQILLQSSSDLRTDTVRSELERYNVWVLNDTHDKWSNYENQIESVIKSCSELSEAYQDDLTKITDYSFRWKLTKETSGDEIPKPLLKRVDDMVFNLQMAGSSFKDSLDVILTLADKVASEHSSIQDIKQELLRISNNKKLNIFAKDSPPLSSSLSGNPYGHNIVEQLRNTFSSSYLSTEKYLLSNIGRAELHLVLFVLLCLLLFVLRHLFNRNNTNTRRFNRTAVYLINRPVQIGIALSIFLGFSIYKDAPELFDGTLLLLVVLSIIPVLKGISKRNMRFMYLYMTVLYLLNYTESCMSSYPYTQRLIILILSVLVMVGMVYLIRTKNLVQVGRAGMFHRLVRSLFPVYMLLSGVAVYANVVGSVFLARILTKTMVFTITLGVILILVYTIFASLVKLLMASNARKYVRLIEVQGRLIQDKILFYTRLVFYWLWFRSFLYQIGLLAYLNDRFNRFLETGVNFGDVYLSIGQVFYFIIIIVVFSVAANIVRDLLAIEILPRLKVKKGIPLAVGLMTRYAILLLGFLMAVAAAGISLDRLGFIAGALGVGIGFGLQSIVGNFVSGLILILERPVRVGDIITSGNVEGTIAEIGIRACRIRDWHGAEVIVPNMDLISQQVANWTLSDSKRRIELFVKVEYGTDPNQVIDIIEAVISKFESVQKEPAPMVLFLGFKEFSADFRVLFWVSENVLSTQSAVSIAIYNALRSAGINIPIPKRELVSGGGAEEPDLNISSEEGPVDESIE